MECLRFGFRSVRCSRRHLHAAHPVSCKAAWPSAPSSTWRKSFPSRRCPSSCRGGSCCRQRRGIPVAVGSSRWCTAFPGPNDGALTWAAHGEKQPSVRHPSQAATSSWAASTNRRLFVEPTVIFTPDDVRCPDLVICNSQRIIGVVEFKYAPRAYAEYNKDIETLHRFVQHADAITLSNERYRGEGFPKSYALAEDAVLCWAAVYADSFIEIEHPNFAALNGHFLRLDAITHSSSRATIRNSMGWEC